MPQPGSIMCESNNEPYEHFS